MKAVRVAWIALAVAGIAVSIWAFSLPARVVSFSCGRGEVLSDIDNPTLTCDDSIATVYGALPTLQVAILLAIPAIIAAITARVAIAWTAAAIYAALFLVGLVDWSTPLGLLLFIAPIFCLAAVLLACAQLIVQANAAHGDDAAEPRSA